MKIFVPTANECKLVTIHDSCISEFQQNIIFEMDLPLELTQDESGL
jgi:hypothetical protein